MDQRKQILDFMVSQGFRWVPHDPTSAIHGCDLCAISVECTWHPVHIKATRLYSRADQRWCSRLFRRRDSSHWARGPLPFPE